MSSCVVTRWPTGAITLDTPYDAEYVEDLKASIPAISRRYDGASRNWVVKPPYVEVAIGILARHFPEGWEERDADVDGARRASSSPSGTPEWAATLFVQPDAPLEVAEAAYRALAKMSHPDLAGARAGDVTDAGRRMASLNDAIATARAARPASASVPKGRAA